MYHFQTFSEDPKDTEKATEQEEPYLTLDDPIKGRLDGTRKLAPEKKEEK